MVDNVKIEDDGVVSPGYGLFHRTGKFVHSQNSLNIYTYMYKQYWTE